MEVWRALLECIGTCCFAHSLGMRVIMSMMANITMDLNVANICQPITLGDTNLVGMTFGNLCKHVAVDAAIHLELDLVIPHILWVTLNLETISSVSTSPTVAPCSLHCTPTTILPGFHCSLAAPHCLFPSDLTLLFATCHVPRQQSLPAPTAAAAAARI